MASKHAFSVNFILNYVWLELGTLLVNMQYPADVKLRYKKFTIYWWKTEIHNLSLSSVKLTTATCDS
jgi:predicted alpha-1,6-mannanase (GH76 family)